MKRVEKQEWRNQLILDNALDYAILTADMDGTIVSWSSGAEKLFGWTKDEVIGQPLDILFTAEDRKNHLPESRRQLASQHHIDAVERFHVRKNGTEFWASGDLQAFFNDEGAQQGFLKIVRDRTAERKHAEELRLSEERVRLAQDAAGIGAFEIDIERNVIEATPQFLKLIGHSHANEISIDKFCSSLIENNKMIARLMTEVKKDESQIVHLEFQIKRFNDSVIRWMGYWAETAPEGTGSKMKHRILGVLQDITERREAQEKQALLSGELAHRVKNILAIVQSIANQTLRNASSLETAANDFSVRLHALAKAQDILTHGAAKSADLRQIIDSSLGIHSYVANRFSISGTQIALSPQAALSMALALHELSTNAVKYGALAGEKGRVKISWKVKNDTFEFQWQEKNGPKVIAPTRKGFGSKLIERLLPAGLNGTATLDYAPQGFSFLLSAPFIPENFPPD